MSSTLAWIAWRDEARAEASATTDAIQVIIEAAEEGRLAVEHPNGAPDLALATASLEEALAAGRIRAAVIEPGTGAVTYIPVEAWADPVNRLVLCAGDRLPFAHLASAGDQARLDEAPWRDPRFHRDDMRREWPAPMKGPDELSRLGRAERKATSDRRKLALQAYAESLYDQGERENLPWALRRNPLPFTREEFIRQFNDRHPALRLAVSTFKSEYRDVGIRFRRGRPRAR